jgi:hypothetical protein
MVRHIVIEIDWESRCSSLCACSLTHISVKLCHMESEDNVPYDDCVHKHICCLIVILNAIQYATLSTEKFTLSLRSRSELINRHPHDISIKESTTCIWNNFVQTTFDWFITGNTECGYTNRNHARNWTGLITQTVPQYPPGGLDMHKRSEQSAAFRRSPFARALFCPTLCGVISLWPDERNLELCVLTKVKKQQRVECSKNCGIGCM